MTFKTMHLGEKNELIQLLFRYWLLAKGARQGMEEKFLFTSISRTRTNC